MKRMLALLLAAVLLLVMTACGGNLQEETEPQVTAAESTQVPETTLPEEDTAPEATEAEQPAEVNGLDLAALYDTLAASMPEMILLDENMMLNFCGIAPEDCVQAVVATCADGLRTDELWLIQAVDADALARLEELAQIRLRMKGEESITYSPEQYAVVEKAQILTDGLYLAVVVSPDVETLSQSCTDAFAQ